MFALGDHNPLTRLKRAHVNHTLIALNAIAFVAQIAGVLTVDNASLIPAAVTGAPLPPGLEGWPLPVRLVSHQFMHGGLLHIGANMLALWVFGDNVEDSMGHVRYLMFYLICGVAGGLAYSVTAPDPMVALIGASGAISGVMGAYLLLHPRARILVMLLGRLPALVPASWFVGFMIVVNLAMATVPAMDAAEAGGEIVAWWAHLGGFATGMLLIVVMRRPGVPLFEAASTYPAVPFPRFNRFLFDPVDAFAARQGGSRALEILVAVLKTAGFVLLLIILAGAF